MRFTTHPLAGKAVTQSFPTIGTDTAVGRRLAASLSTLASDGDRLTAEFYRRLFDRHPGVRALFPADMTAQRQKLLQTLEWVVQHLDQPHVVLPAVAELGRRHRDYGAVAAHYPIVRDLLLEAMEVVAGKTWSSDLRAEWRTAIELLSQRMIEASNAAPPSTPPTKP